VLPDFLENVLQRLRVGRPLASSRVVPMRNWVIS
jgi:hypothetical protein